MKKNLIKTICSFLLMTICLSPLISMAITETDNGIMAVYIRNYGMDTGLEMGDDSRGFDIKGYINTSGDEKTLISSTFGNYGYHVFLNVNGANGEMNGKLQNTNEEKLKAMQYTAYDSSNEWQTIDGIKLKVSTQFINEGEQLQIMYDLKNTTSSSVTYSLATAADVEIDDDDHATIDRLEDGSGIRLWTKDGDTKKPVQFVFYGKDVPGTTAIDNLYIGNWNSGGYLEHIFDTNPETNQIKDLDSAFAFSWVNRTLNAGDTQYLTVLMEVGEINLPNTGIILENNTKFYYKDVKINGTVIDKDLKDIVTVHYVVDGTEYTLPTMSTTGASENFTLDLTSLNLAPVTPHTLKVWATDSTECPSNVEERTFTITYVKEPEVTISTEEWAKDVTFKIKDNVNEAQWVDTYQYRLNNGDWIDCEKDTNIPVNENGNVKVDVRVKGTKQDDYSNIVTVNAKVDNEKPSTSKPTANITTCSITVNLEQTDNYSGIDTSKTMYAIKKDGEWSEWQSSNVFSGLTHDTEYEVKTRTEDKAGNISESEVLTAKTEKLLLGNLIIKLNNSEGENYTEDTWTNQNIYVAIEERTTGAITKYKSKENSAQTIAETNQETTITTDGITTITLSVTDGTNTVTSDEEHILKVDKVEPIISSLTLDNEEWSSSVKNVTGSAKDELSGIVAYQFSNQGDLTSNSTGWTEITATNDVINETKEVNSEKIYFYVKDVAGNVTSSHLDTKIDSQGPVINFSRANGKTAINVTDIGAGVKTIQYAWTEENTEPSNWNNYSEAVKYSGTNKGKIYLWAKATDNAGNYTINSTSFSELKTPNIVSENEFVNKNIIFKLTGDTEDEDVLYQFKINDGEWQGITKDSNHTITDIANGTVKVSARILDNAGRFSDINTKNIKVSFVNQNTDVNSTSDDNNNSRATGGNDTSSKTNNNGTTSTTKTGGNTNPRTDSTVTTATTLPNTGIRIKVVFIICVLVLLGGWAFYKCHDLKDVK